MNEKQQLAAMGAQYRLTEEQAKALAERMPKAGVLQILDDEPLCMAKRIEELEAQVRVMAELLRDLHEYIGTSIPRTVSDHYRGCDLLERIDAAMAGSLPSTFAPEGWKLVPAVPTEEMCEAGANAPLKVRQSEKCWIGDIYASMLAAAPKPEAK